MRKTLSFILTAVMIFCMVLPAVATENIPTAEYDGYPLIVVRGIDATGLRTDDGSPAIKIGFNDVLTFTKNYFRQLIIEKNEDAFISCAFELADKVLEPISIDKEGNSVHSISVEKYTSSMAAYPQDLLDMEDIGEHGIIKTAVDRIGAENVYYFTYDWRMSAKHIAGDLDSYIKNVLAETGMDKVKIIAVSMGGMVTTAYLYHYGADKIDTLLYLSSAHNGTYGPGDAFNGNINIDGNVIYNSLRKSFSGKIIPRFFIDITNKIGVFDVITLIADKILGENPQLINNDVVRNHFGTLLGLWAMCPDDVFESGVEFMFGGHEEEYPVIIEKLQDTKSFIFSTEETIDRAIESGVKISFVSNYNIPLAPYYKHSYLQGDGVLETVLTSNFATVAPYGETLTEEQLVKADKNYVSPDGIIDASTSLYRDMTWFVKDAQHVAATYGSEYADFVMWLVMCDSQPTVMTNPLYPQFMGLDEIERLVALK